MNALHGARSSFPVSDSTQTQDEPPIDSVDGSLLPSAVNVEKVAADLVDKLLTEIPEECDRGKFVSEMRDLDWKYMKWHVADDVTHMMSRVSLAETNYKANFENSSVVKIVYDDCAGEMWRSIDQFSTEIQTWTVISCATANSHVVRRIAIGEGDSVIRMVEMFDLEQPELSLNDRLERFFAFGEERNHEQTVHRRVVTSATFQPPNAITRDDVNLIKWLISRLTARETHISEVIKSMSKDGQNVFHQGAVANSPMVSKHLCSLLSKAHLVDMLEEMDINDKTPIYLAAYLKNASALHQLLKPLNKNNLEKLLNDRRKTQTVLQLVQDDPNYLEIKAIVEYHRQLREEDQLENFFDTFKYSLFSYTIRPHREDIVHNRVEDERPINDPGAKRNVNLDAATCLLKDDREKAKKLIDRAIEIAPDDVHTWCNKAKYALLEDGSENRREAKKTGFRVLDLLTDKFCGPRVKAKIDYAYFIVEANREEKDRKESVKIFEECLSELEPFSDPAMVELKAYCSYHYTKTLMRGLKSDKRFKATSDENRDVLHKTVDQIILLDDFAKATESPEYAADMWLWLAEFQFLSLPNDFITAELEEFKQRTGYQDIKPEVCLTNSTEIAVHNEGKVECKTRVHIARNFLKVAYDEYQKERRLYFLQRAHDDCEWWLKKYYWTFECANTCAQALWCQWITEIYFQHKDLVKETFSRVKGGRSAIRNDAKGLEYVSMMFYHPSLKSDPEITAITAKYLPKAIPHLEALVEKPDGWGSIGVKYARILFLLDKDIEHIEYAFSKAYEEADSGVRKAKVAEAYGLYYGWIDDHNMAEYWFRQAIDDCKSQAGGSKYEPRTALSGQQIIKRGRKFY